jgi:hypothetical protein
MCRDDRNTHSLGRSVLPEILRRRRECSRSRWALRESLLTGTVATLVLLVLAANYPAVFAAPAFPAFFFKRSPAIRIPFCL